MKRIIRHLSMAALALMGTVITACSSSDDTIADTPKQPENTGKVVTLKTTVGFDDSSATTRALDIDFTNKKAVKTFAEGEKMAVIYKNTSGETVKAVSAALKDGDIVTTGDAATNKKSATFTFELTDPDSSQPIRYIYPAAMAKETVATDAAINDAGTVDFTNLNAQDGTMDALGSNLDLCTFDAANWTSGALPSGTLSNQLAVLAVTVKDDKATEDTEDDDPITASVTRLTVSDGTNKYTATGHDADGHIYLAVLPTTSADITVDIYTAAHHYVKALADKKTYAASNLYNVGWKVNQKAEPMTMQATRDGTIVVDKPRSGMQYSKNGGAKTTMTGNTTITVSAGDKVEFYGNGTSITSYNGTTIAGGTAEVKVYGNIMSLVDEEGFAANTTLPEKFTFNSLFYYNGKLTDASGLLLPAEKLKSNCYDSMFEGCTSLTTAPAALPAEKLAGYCYREMFFVCESLTDAPALPAPTLATGCYSSMFYGCMNLSAVTCLATNISASDCTSNWLYNAGTDVTGTKTFTKAASMTGWTTGVNGIPSGWTVQDAE